MVAFIVVGPSYDDRPYRKKVNLKNRKRRVEKTVDLVSRNEETRVRTDNW